MIIALEGKIFSKEPTKIAISCSGVVYEVFFAFYKPCIFLSAALTIRPTSFFSKPLMAF